MNTIKLQESQGLFGDMLNEQPFVDRDALADALSVVLSGLTLDEFVGLITNRYSEMIAYVDLCLGSKTCQKTSLLFNPHRLDTASVSGPSVYSSLQDKSFCNGLARATLFKKDKVSELLYQAIQLGINSRCYCGEFLPHVARNLCSQNGITSASRILDPCGGWGGRMLGVSAVCDMYECYEPSTRTASGLIKLRDFIRSFRPEFTAEVRIEPFEDASFGSALYDMALTSPPYYDTERYTDEESNSCNRYGNFNEWCSGFFGPLIDKTMRALKPGCPFVLNIGSRKYPLNDILREHCRLSQLNLRKIGNLLSGSGGFGKNGEGEMFYLIRSIGGEP